MKKTTRSQLKEVLSSIVVTAIFISVWVVGFFFGVILDYIDFLLP